MTADDPVLRAALTEKLESLIAHHRREASHSLGKYGVEHSAKAEAFRQVLELVAALAGRFVDDTHRCAQCGIRWTGVAGAVYCGDCHRAALAGRPEAEPVIKTWITINGRSCHNCGHVLTEHREQRYCPPHGDAAEAGRPDAEDAETELRELKRAYEDLSAAYHELLEFHTSGEPVCPRCKRPISEIAARLAIEREDAAARGPFAPGAGR